MNLRSELAWLVSGLTGDTSKILFDQPGAAFDQLHGALENTISLPVGLRGRAVLVGIALLAKNLLRGSPSAPGPLRRFVGEVTDDAVIETLKRIIEHAGVAPVAIPITVAVATEPAREPLARRIDALTRTIAPWMGQKEA